MMKKSLKRGGGGIEKGIFPKATPFDVERKRGHVMY